MEKEKPTRSLEATKRGGVLTLFYTWACFPLKPQRTDIYQTIISKEVITIRQFHLNLSHGRSGVKIRLCLIRLPNIVLMLVHRLRRWSNIKTNLAQYLVFVRILRAQPRVWHSITLSYYVS